MTLIPKLRFTDAGIIAPSVQEVKAGLWRVMEHSFGENLNKQESTPQGQWVVSMTAEIVEQNNTIINLMNLVDPRFSYGVMQDGIGEIYFLTRRGATRSIVQLTFRGLSGVVIPEGMIVGDINGHQWQTTESKFIGTNGAVTIHAQSLTEGAIVANAGVINKIITNQEDVDSVINNTSAVVGRDVESREDFEERRRESVAANGKNTNINVLGSVSDVEGVIDCHVVDNPTDATITVGATNYPLIRNSLAVSVVGGNDQEIAKQILIKGGSGCSFVGNTEVTYYDSENYPEFPPKYDINFIRPTHIPVYFTVEVDNLPAIGFDQEKYIKTQILNAFKEGRLKAQIGQRVVANRFMCQVANVENNIVMGIYIGLTADQKVNVLDFGIDQFPVLSELNITISEAQ